MTKKKDPDEPNKVGRPRKEISKESFEKLCAMQCTRNEIASFFECHGDTVENWCVREYGLNFSDTYRQKADIGKMSMRRAQWKRAVEDQNVTMLIWLGKQYLGQSDKVEISEEYELTTEFTKHEKTTDAPV